MDNKIRFIGGELDGELVPSQYGHVRRVYNNKRVKFLDLSVCDDNAKSAKTPPLEMYKREEYRYGGLSFLIFMFQGMAEKR